MAASRADDRRYCRCGARLAADNPAERCAPCQRELREQLTASPVVPASFWLTPQMQDAFAAQHMGRVARAYRLHAHHQAVYGAAGITQALLGQWMGMTQAQVSRIENGAPIKNLDTLTHWAQVLRTPSELLWFDLPGSSRADIASGLKRRSLLVVGGAAAVDKALPAATRVTQTLDIVTSDGADTLSVAVDILDDLMTHYSETLTVSPPTSIYDDLLNVRAYAGTLLRRTNSSPYRSDILVAVGWLSNLLAVATSLMGDHGAAMVW